MIQKRSSSFYLARIGFVITMGIVLFYLIFPFYWAFISSLKTENELIQPPATYWPQQITLENYRNVLSRPEILQGIINSAIVAGAVVVLSLTFGSFSAYALGRLQFRGKRPLLYIILSMTLFPQIAVLPGLFKIITDLRMYGSLWSLITTYLIFTLPLTTWILMTFYRSLPDELEQAALVDGATLFQTFYLILLPLTMPALVTTGLLTFIAAWNEYLFAASFTATSPNVQTVTVAIANFRGVLSHAEPFGEIMAATIIVTLPLLVLVLIFQQRIIYGLTAGAVKE
jgi:trehalose/maltose transport system permease protein